MPVLKVGAVEMEYREGFKGEVTVVRGEKSVTVPIEAIERLIAEKDRHDLIEGLQTAKPDAVRDVKRKAFLQKVA